jgi:hypothetical protein
MSYCLEFYNSGSGESFPIEGIRERVVTVELEPGYWDIVVIAYYGTVIDDAFLAALDKKPQVEIRAGQMTSVSFTMEADEFITPNRAEWSNQDITIGTGDYPPSLLVKMNTTTAFSGISGWDDHFSYRWYYETGGSENSGSSGSFSSPGTAGLTQVIDNSSVGTFQYYVEITNNFDYEGNTTTVKNSILVATVTVVGGALYSTVGNTGPGGGKIFYIDSGGFFSNGVTCHYLEVGPTDLGPAQWGLSGTSVGTTATGIGTGYGHTQDIITALSGTSETGRAAQIADTYFTGGYGDWFLPSQGELVALYGSGVSGLSSPMWSSTENDGSAAVSVASGGSYSNYPKTTSRLFRPVRAF